MSGHGNQDTDYLNGRHLEPIKADKPSVEGLAEWLRRPEWHLGAPSEKTSRWADAVERLASQSAAAPPIADAWMSEDGDRVVPRSTRETADREGGASAAAMRAYPVPLYAAPPSAVLLEVLEALEVAKNGLAWYRDEMPKADSQADDEAETQIDAAIAKLRTLMGADHG